MLLITHKASDILVRPSSFLLLNFYGAIAQRAPPIILCSVFILFSHLYSNLWSVSESGF